MPYSPYIRTNIVFNLLLDRSGLSWLELCKEFEIDAASSHDPRWMQLLNCLYSLSDVQLIIVDEIPDDRVYRYIEGVARDFLYNRGHAVDQERHHMRIRVSDNWLKIQRVLKVEVRPAYQDSEDYSTVAHPLFGQPHTLPVRANIFVLMPFSEALRPIYEDHISNVARSLNLTVMRADDLFTSNSMISDVWSGIFNAGAIIADCTGRNPNVFYEIGIAHTLGKPVILITQNTDDVPVDLRHIKYIKYEYTPRGICLLEVALADTLKSIMKLD